MPPKKQRRKLKKCKSRKNLNRLRLRARKAAAKVANATESLDASEAPHTPEPESPDCNEGRGDTDSDCVDADGNSGKGEDSDHQATDDVQSMASAFAGGQADEAAVEAVSSPADDADDDEKEDDGEGGGEGDEPQEEHEAMMQHVMPHKAQVHKTSPATYKFDSHFAENGYEQIVSFIEQALSFVDDGARAELAGMLSAGLFALARLVPVQMAQWSLQRHLPLPSARCLVLNLKWNMCSPVSDTSRSKCSFSVCLPTRLRVPPWAFSCRRLASCAQDLDLWPSTFCTRRHGNCQKLAS